MKARKLIQQVRRFLDTEPPPTRAELEALGERMHQALLAYVDLKFEELYRAKVQPLIHNVIVTVFDEALAGGIRKQVDATRERDFRENINAAVREVLEGPGRRTLNPRSLNILDRAAAKGREKQPKFNTDKTRYIQWALLGWACYKGAVVNGDFTGEKVGVLQHDHAAENWLNDTADWPRTDFDDWFPGDGR